MNEHRESTVWAFHEHWNILFTVVIMKSGRFICSFRFFISLRNNRILFVFSRRSFGRVPCLCTLNDTFHFMTLYPQRCNLILLHLSSLKEFTILKLYYLTLTKEKICIASNVTLFKRWRIVALSWRGPSFWISDEWCFNYLFPLLRSPALFIPLWKRNAVCELVNETMPSLVSENEELFVWGVPFQFEGSAERLLFGLLNQDFEW